MKEPNILYIAVKALIKNSDGKVLILKQSDPTITGGGQYHPPGGIVELSESIKQCLKREIQEELGVEAAVKRLFDVGEWRAERNTDVMQFVGIFYVCELESEEFTLQQEEASEVCWAGLGDIETLDILEPSKSLIKRFLQE